MKAKMVETRSIGDSRTETELLAFPADANTMGIVYGGRILYWVDMLAGLVARKHCGGPVATIRVEFDFLTPVHVNDHVRLSGFVTRTYERSFEVQVDVYAAGGYGREERLAARGYLLFSALDREGKAVPAPQVQPENDEERRRWEAAGRRRELRKRWRELEDGQ